MWYVKVSEFAMKMKQLVRELEGHLYVAVVALSCAHAYLLRSTMSLSYTTVSGIVISCKSVDKRSNRVSTK